MPPLFNNFSSETVNLAYIKKALAKSQLIFKPKSPRLLSEDRFLYKDNAAVHAATLVQDFKWQHGIKTIRQLPYLPDIALAVLFLCRKMKTVPDEHQEKLG